MSRPSHLPKAPRSTRVPWKPCEAWWNRHQRRLNAANDDRNNFEAWAEKRGGELKVSAGGAHWQIRVDGKLWERWPQTGRVVRDKQFDSPKKVHDTHQLKSRIGSELSKARRERP